MSLLLKLKTDLKSLKPKLDRPFGPPYVSKDISKQKPSSGTFFGDFYTLQIKRRLEDTERISKWFLDVPGLFFTNKQNILIQSSPKTQTHKGFYSPVKTILSVGASGTGVFFDKLTGQQKYNELINPITGVVGEDRLKSIYEGIISTEPKGFINKLIELKNQTNFKENTTNLTRESTLSRTKNPDPYPLDGLYTKHSLEEEHSFNTEYKTIDEEAKIEREGKLKTKSTRFKPEPKEKKEPKFSISLSPDIISLNKVSQTKPDDPDLVKFLIAYVKPNNERDYIQFRAYLKPITDTYNSDWKTHKYSGRGEEFYSYIGFGRNITFSFTILVTSKQEQQNLYTKLNTLVSLNAPTYRNNFMQGNIIELTIGNYVKDQPGILQGFTLDIGEESSWDIDDGSQLPMLIGVNGFNFKPIHTFLPEYGIDRKFINQI